MIKFEKIKWKNIMSYGNYWTEIDLKNINKTLIIGKNGSGKSTLLEAIVFALYGKPYRKITKPLLVNSITKKNLVVELEFNSYNDSYKIIRGIKPNIFEIYKNGSLLNQEGNSTDYQDILETQILRKNIKTFTQVDILGSAKYTSFMELSAPDRRKVIEDLMDLQVFSSMNLVTKQKILAIDTEINSLNQQYELLTVKRNSLIKLEESTKKIYQEQLEDNLNEQQILSNVLNENKNIYLTLDNDIKDLELEKIKFNFNELKEKKNNYNTAIIKLSTKIDTLSNEIDFFKNNDNCPTCKQIIDTIFKNSSIQEKETKTKEYLNMKNTFELDKKELQSTIDDYLIIEEKINKLINQKNNLTFILKNDKTKLDNLKNKWKELNDKLKINNVDLSADLVDLQLELSNLEVTLNDRKTTKKKLNLILSSLKDTGIKAIIIKEYVPVLNKLITKYLNKMDFMVSFELTETFEEIIKSRYCDEFVYGSFSEGQKAKINLALLFAFRDIARMRNSSSSNLLLMDEILNTSIDKEGIECLFSILNDLNSNIIIIAHHLDENLYYEFDKVYEFSLEKNFSTMKELQ